MQYDYFISWPVEVDIASVFDIPAVEIIEVNNAPVITIQNESIILAFDGPEIQICGGNDDETE